MHCFPNHRGLRDLVPADVVVVEGTGGDPPEVLPEEQAHLASAVEGRRVEFEQGRTCSRRALRALGIEGWPLLPDGRRAPVWPPGVVGAITHTEGYVAAAVARRPDGASLGIDAEQRTALPRGVQDMVCTEPERSWCREHAADRVPWATVLFSAKESVYKAWYPLTGCWLGYLDADIELIATDDTRGHFSVRALRTPVFPPSSVDFRGGYLLTPDLVLTAVVVDAPGTRTSPR